MMRPRLRTTSPFPVLMMVAVGASSAFLTPIASPVNTLVMGPGNYRFFDFARFGLPLIVLVLAVSLLLVPPMFESFIKPHLAKWDAEMASDGERRIAQRMNEKAGWTNMEQLATTA